jgi:hypothetical protein
MAADFAVDDELSTALVGVEGNLEAFAAMWAGDRYKLVHGVKYSGKRRV